MNFDSLIECPLFIKEKAVCINTFNKILELATPLNTFLKGSICLPCIKFACILANELKSFMILHTILVANIPSILCNYFWSFFINDYFNYFCNVY